MQSINLAAIAEAGIYELLVTAITRARASTNKTALNQNKTKQKMNENSQITRRNPTNFACVSYSIIVIKMKIVA